MTDGTDIGGGKPAAMRINVSGRVQGVGFRYTTQQKASRLGLTGWVRNERDGSVEIHCEGAPERIAALLDWLEAGGPSYCRIHRAGALRRQVHGDVQPVFGRVLSRQRIHTGVKMIPGRKVKKKARRPVIRYAGCVFYR